ncbi:MAG: hypothetical protein KDN19_23285 [Verrucomicrobiae bacterium]|nr:hypothetical protein [Verrucomicrobiae bacterium]
MKTGQTFRVSQTENHFSKLHCSADGPAHLRWTPCSFSIFLLLATVSLLGGCCGIDRNCGTQGCLDCDYTITGSYRTHPSKNTVPLYLNLVDENGKPIDDSTLCPEYRYSVVDKYGKAEPHYHSRDGFHRLGKGQYKGAVPADAFNVYAAVRIRGSFLFGSSELHPPQRIKDESGKITGWKKTFTIRDWKHQRRKADLQRWCSGAEVECHACGKGNFAKPSPLANCPRHDTPVGSFSDILEPQTLRLRVIDTQGNPIHPKGLCAEVLFDRIQEPLAVWKFGTAEGDDLGTCKRIFYGPPTVHVGGHLHWTIWIRCEVPNSRAYCFDIWGKAPADEIVFTVDDLKWTKSSNRISSP